MNKPYFLSVNCLEKIVYVHCLHIVLWSIWLFGPRASSSLPNELHRKFNTRIYISNYHRTSHTLMSTWAYVNWCMCVNRTVTCVLFLYTKQSQFILFIILPAFFSKWLTQWVSTKMKTKTLWNMIHYIKFSSIHSLIASKSC